MTTNNTSSSPSPLSPVFSSTEFPEQLIELQHIPFKLSSARGKPTLEQTKRNKMREELVDSLTGYLDTVLDGTGASVYRVGEGIAIEVPHDQVYKAEQEQGLGSTTNGTIVVVLDATVQCLEYDAYQEHLDWEEEHQAKLEQAKIRQAKKDQAEAKKKKKTQENK